MIAKMGKNREKPKVLCTPSDSLRVGFDTREGWWALQSGFRTDFTLAFLSHGVRYGVCRGRSVSYISPPAYTCGTEQHLPNSSADSAVHAKNKTDRSGQGVQGVQARGYV
jgi:hypothetical protein